jgi:hypothetical protein
MTYIALRPAVPADAEFCYQLHQALGAYIIAIPRLGPVALRADNWHFCESCPGGVEPKPVHPNRRQRTDAGAWHKQNVRRVGRSVRVVPIPPELIIVPWRKNRPLGFAPAGHSGQGPRSAPHRAGRAANYIHT